MMKRLDADVQRLCHRLYRGLDTPRALTCDILLRYGEWGQLANLTVDPLHYADARAYALDAQATEFLRKYPGLPIKVDRRAVAEEGFWAAEAQCKRTNDRLDRWLNDPVFYTYDELAIWKFIQTVKKTIRTILGPIPNDLKGKFGPGAVFESRTKQKSVGGFTLGDKMQLRPASTSDAALYASHYVYNTWWGRSQLLDRPYQSSLQIVPGNRFTTVPKDALKDRGICIEPGCNVFLQLALGQVIRERLRFRAGIDLEQGQDVHRQAAADSSLYGDFSTIDLSSASDTVSRKIVQLLLPQDWFTLLDDLRSKRTLVNGKWVYLEKFSSMGNGFTFELETLIFYALSKCALRIEDCEKRVLVYGDDIIVPAGSTREVLAVLRYFGFTPNPRKTYTSGVFRESCGGDFFLGRNVRPYYLKEIPREPSDWIALANGLYRVGTTTPIGMDPLHSARFSALDNLPTDVRRCVGPVNLGDLVIHDDPTYWNFVVRNSIRYFRCWRPVHFRKSFRRFTTHTQLALALYGAPSSGLIPRNAVSGYRFGRVSYS